MFTMSRSRALLSASALLTGGLLLAAAAQAGNTSLEPTNTTVNGAGSGVVLQINPLKCERSGAVDFPYAKITNVGAATIKKGKVIAYKFANGMHAQLTLKADLVTNASVVSSEGTDPGYKCTASLL